MPSPTTRAGGEGPAEPRSAALTMLGNMIYNLAQPQVSGDRETVLRSLREIERTLRMEITALASAGTDGGTQGAELQGAPPAGDGLSPDARTAKRSEPAAFDPARGGAV